MRRLVLVAAGAIVFASCYSGNIDCPVVMEVGGTDTAAYRGPAFQYLPSRVGMPVYADPIVTSFPEGRASIVEESVRRYEDNQEPAEYAYTITGNEAGTVGLVVVQDLSDSPTLSAQTECSFEVIEVSTTSTTAAPERLEYDTAVTIVGGSSTFIGRTTSQEWWLEFDCEDGRCDGVVAFSPVGPRDLSYDEGTGTYHFAFEVPVVQEECPADRYSGVITPTIWGDAGPEAFDFAYGFKGSCPPGSDYGVDFEGTATRR